MSSSFLLASANRTADTLPRPLPIDDALAALELHAPICEVGAGDGVWSALLRARGLCKVVAYDWAPPATAITEVRRGGADAASLHTDHTLLLIRPSDCIQALRHFLQAGGHQVAHVGCLCPASDFATLLESKLEKQVTVLLPAASEALTIWQKRQPTQAGQATTGVLDVRLELCDLEAPDWAAPPSTANGSVRPATGNSAIFTPPCA